LSSWYLIDAAAEGGGAVRLKFYDPSEDALKEFRDSTCKPYFFVPYPLSKHDEEAIQKLHGEVEVVKKVDLYTNQNKEVAKVKVYKPEFLTKATRMFETVWENEIEFRHSYVYDHGLVFGAQHLVQDNNFTSISAIQEGLKTRFDEVFGNVKAVDPLKYSQLERWFTLLHQPVPQVKPEMLATGEVNPDKYQIAFVLSRIANLPIPQA